MGRLGRVKPVVPHDGVDSDDDSEQIDAENAAFERALRAYEREHGRRFGDTGAD